MPLHAVPAGRRTMRSRVHVFWFTMTVFKCQAEVPGVEYLGKPVKLWPQELERKDAAARHLRGSMRPKPWALWARRPNPHFPCCANGSKYRRSARQPLFRLAAWYFTQEQSRVGTNCVSAYKKGAVRGILHSHNDSER